MKPWFPVVAVGGFLAWGAWKEDKTIRGVLDDGRRDKINYRRKRKQEYPYSNAVRHRIEQDAANKARRREDRRRASEDHYATGPAWSTMRHGRGRRAERYTEDQYTGEPLPPYSGRGRPRSYNSLATKFAAVRQGEWFNSTMDLPAQGHIWTADKLAALRSDLGSMRNDFNSTPVCDGGLRFRGEPQLFDRKNGKQIETGPLRGRDLYECYARPGKDETGEIMLMSRYYNALGKRRAALRKAITAFVAGGPVNEKALRAAFPAVAPTELAHALRILVKVGRLTEAGKAGLRYYSAAA